MKLSMFFSIALFEIGALIAIVSIIADFVGLGGPYFMFGPKQIIGTAVGSILALIGLVDILRKNR